MLMNDDQQQHNPLPFDITIEILSRSSVDSVLQCKRVCKSWLALINSPDFGHTHTDRLLQQQNNSASFDLFLSTRITGHIDQYHIGKYNDVGMGTLMVKKLITHDDYPLGCPDNGPSWFPIGSCNGLVCFIHMPKGGYDVCIYNPLTREYVNLLPRLSTNMSRYSLFHTGFGYHSRTKEYKVVSIYYETLFSATSCAQVSIYTLGNACKWRRKRDIPHQLLGDSVLVNEALHWLSSTNCLEANTRNIVSFDLADEEFRIVPLPPPCLRHIQLGVLEGCLSAGGRNSYCSPNSLDVWVMKNNNSHKADQDCPWTKKYNIQWNETMRGPSYAPFDLLKEGKILLRYNDTKIVSYNPETASFGGFHPIENLLEMFPYMKSFVSLKALGEDGARISRRLLASNNGGESSQQLLFTRKRKR